MNNKKSVPKVHKVFKKNLYFTNIKALYDTGVFGETFIFRINDNL